MRFLIWASANAGFAIINDLCMYGIGRHAQSHGGLAAWKGYVRHSSLFCQYLTLCGTFAAVGSHSSSVELPSSSRFSFSSSSEPLAKSCGSRLMRRGWLRLVLQSTRPVQTDKRRRGKSIRLGRLSPIHRYVLFYRQVLDIGAITQLLYG